MAAQSLTHTPCTQFITWEHTIQYTGMHYPRSKPFHKVDRTHLATYLKARYYEKVDIGQPAKLLN